jgi:hypothetical protein
MTTGAQRAEAQPEDGSRDTDQADRDAQMMTEHESGDAEASGQWAGDEAEEAESTGGGRRLLAALLILLALAWVAACAWPYAAGGGFPALPALLRTIALASGPLILLGVVWMLWGRSSRSEAARFTRAVVAMRGESAALETLLAIVATRLEENHARLTNEAAKLMALGDEASDRLGRVTHYLSKETKTLDAKAQALEAAAAAARVDIGVLLQDLPRAEEQARSLGGALRETGLAAHEQAGSLDGQIAALVSRGREADDVVGGAAQRLAAHLGRIESNAASAASRMNEAAAGMNAAIDGSLERAAEAIDASRAGIGQQGAALLALIEQSRAAFERAGDESGRSLAARLDQIAAQVQALAENLASQDVASHQLVDRLGGELAQLDTRFAALSATGSSSTSALEGAIGNVREAVGQLAEELGGGEDRAVQLIGRAQSMTEMLAAIGAQLGGEVPAALERVERQARQADEAAAAIAPRVAAIEASATGAVSRFDEVGRQVNGLAEKLAEQDQASRALVQGVARELAQLDADFVSLGATGGSNTEALSNAIASIRSAVGELAAELGNGEGRAELLTGRARSMADAVAAIGEQLNGSVPAALERVEQQARRTDEAAAAIAPRVGAMEASAAQAAAALAGSQGSVERQTEALQAMLGIIDDGVRSAEDRLQALAVAIGEADNAAARIVSDTSPELVDALVRVRDTAQQAAERAREAIAEVIPRSATALAQASRHALSEAVTGEVGATVDELNRMAERAIEAARKASEGLTRQMVAIGRSAGMVEARIEEARREREQKDSEGFSRRVALLIESLNSTAIDVTKILSNDVTDSAWSAYLKGDRGVFTRRAVRLLDATEVREIVQHYEAEPEFREQVNRYVGDFEAMLRQVLADREGSTLAVTILSSDMGKLYVALAQAIDRLRI